MEYGLTQNMRTILTLRCGGIGFQKSVQHAGCGHCDSYPSIVQLLSKHTSLVPQCCLCNAPPDGLAKLGSQITVNHSSLKPAKGWLSRQ